MDLRELYQQVIVDHNRNPRNFKKLAEPCSHAEGHNPLCGDKVTVYVHVEDDIIQDISFQGDGCAISVASASLMTEHLKGKSLAQEKELFKSVHNALTEKDSAIDLMQFGKLGVLANVKNFPMRVKCATLCWHTLEAALANQEAATTE